jgi:integrase
MPIFLTHYPPSGEKSRYNTIMATIYFRKLKPSGAHKSYRFQKQIDGGRWSTVSNDEIKALNKALKDKKNSLSERDIEVRAEAILQNFYRERDKELGVDLILPGNQKIYDDWWKKAYSPAKVKLKKYSASYLPSEKLYFQRALKAAGNVPIDGNDEVLQSHLDDVLEEENDKHHAVVSRINRIRKSLKLPLLIPASKERRDVDYLTKPEIDKLLLKLKEPHRTLAAVAFYTGLRKNEIMAMKDNIWKDDTIEVHWQFHAVDKELRLPKNKKTRTAFIIPGGELWLENLIKIIDTINPTLAVFAVVKRACGKRFHDLRHSYAVYLIGKGMSLDWVAQSLGNSRDVCERHYATHILQKDSIELMRAMLKKVN